MKQSTKYLKILCNLFVAILVIILLIYVLPKALAYFTPFVSGFILSLIANPLVRFLEKKIKIKRKYGSVLMIVLAIGVVVLVCYGVVSALIYGLQSFVTYLPTMYADAGVELNQAGRQLQLMIDHIPFLQNINVSEIGSTLSIYVTDFFSDGGQPTVLALGDIAKRIPDILFGVIIGLLATYFFIADRDKLIALIERHVAEETRGNILKMWNQIVKAVGGYFEAQFKIMFVIWGVIWIGLAILHVRYAWLIGFGIAFLDMLPVFGTGAVLWPWAVVKLFSGNYVTALGMIILYAVAQVVHQVIQPKLISESVGMDTFAALFFMFIGYKSKGVLGMIIAIPVGMLLMNLYEVGAFDTLIWCVKEIVRDFNNFRKLPKE